LVFDWPQRNEASFVPRKSFGAVQIRVANKPLWPIRRVAVRRGRQDKDASFPVLEPKLIVGKASSVPPFTDCNSASRAKKAPDQIDKG
jgi:hypothetical protein